MSNAFKDLKRHGTQPWKNLFWVLHKYKEYTHLHNGDALIGVSYLEKDCRVRQPLVPTFVLFPL